jgi:heat shock protein HslJ
MHRIQTLALIACLMGGCQPAADTGSEGSQPAAMSIETGSVVAIEDILWQVEALLTDSGEMGSPLPETVMDIRFSGGELGGSAGCNRYFGSYSLQGESGLSVSSEMGSTQMACAPPVNAQEQLFLSQLSRAAGWNVAADSLVLSDQGGQTLLELRPAELPELEGVAWQATGINNGKGGVVSSAVTYLASATFADGTVRGSGGCNQFHAPYEIDGDQISIGPPASTRKLCAEPEGIMEQELQYFEALANAATFQLTPGRLELRDDHGSLQVGFKHPGV